MNRVSKENYYLDIAETVAERATCLRRKFGAIIGKDVHTGIHTSIYPGRKIWAGMNTRPGDIIQQDLRNAPDGD